VSCAWNWRSGRKARLPLVHFSTISPRLPQLHVLVLPSAIAVAGDRDAGRDRLRERHLQEFHGVLFADAVIGVKAIGSLGVRPVLAHRWDALTDGASDPPKHFAEPLCKSLIPILASRYLSINPRLCLNGTAEPSSLSAAGPSLENPWSTPGRESGAQQ
jgi:hypothetical protein